MIDRQRLARTAPASSAASRAAEANRFPAIVDAALRLKATSFLIDGEAVIAHDDGTPDFHALRNRRRGREVVLYAFDLIEHDGEDLRKLPLIERKRRLAKLIGRSKRRAIQFVEHLVADGPTVFDHVCRMGWEGIVSADGCALSQRAIDGVAQGEEPGERGGAAGT